MKFGKPLDYSMMLTAPLRESLHWKSYKMPRPDQPDGLRRMPGPVAGLHGDRVGEPRHQAGPSVGRARIITSCLTSRSPGPAKPREAKLPERLEAAVRGDTPMMCGQLHTLHRDDRGGEECRRSVRWERKGPGSAVDRLLDIFHIKITHLLVKIKFRYFCYDTIVLMYYLVLHCVSSCLVLGRECNDLQVYPHLRNVRGICQPIAHHIVVFKPLCCSDCQSDLGWQLQDTGTR